jgi:hypothetical protein
MHMGKKPGRQRQRTTIAVDRAVADEIRELVRELTGGKANLSDFAETAMREKLARIEEGVSR